MNIWINVMLLLIVLYLPFHFVTQTVQSNTNYMDVDIKWYF